ncbi:PLP-dependent aminotransferase family protein [Streptomyces sp. DSM 44938]|uniref:PLP-dependent aminotransferase family protein n=1 Tax=Streptomyces litchfieldiae TaxID=3075543 RepID=A0ABU2MSR8_9ACTN|nr:PLP-dependent aminotransferase family protein [Streptomyces sp. DSM 44938]MDT0344368.1 PLP-dependent aminotransferase family protein [Streptomyces sp. DSM 44938]
MDSWAISPEGTGLDLHLDLSGGGGVRAGLMRALRDAIRTGRLAPGTRLPSSRSLAADLGVARNTVADSYAELAAEGWLVARQGSGTRVAPRAASRARPPGRRVPEPRRAVAPPAVNLLAGRPDAGAFPRAAWLASARRALTAAPTEAFGLGDPHGRPELRRALADYLARARGVLTDPDRIVVCSGAHQAMRLLARVRELRRAPLAVESYGLFLHQELFSAEGVRTVPLAVDELGADVGALADTGARSVLLTPAHQFPLGVPLHAERRAAVVDWARATGGLVLEDDYDGEFRYDREPVGALQGLDPERVVYLGSASKSLSPALRLGWMVLPGHLVDDVLAAKGPWELTAGSPDQLTLADFLDSGGFDRHVRRVRQRYRRRRDQLVATLAARAPHIRVTGIAAGLHAVLRLPPGTEEPVVREARRRGIALTGLGRYRHASFGPPLHDGLVVGYGTPPDHDFAAALDALCAILPPLNAGARRPSSPPRRPATSTTKDR